MSFEAYKIKNHICIQKRDWSSRCNSLIPYASNLSKVSNEFISVILNCTHKYIRCITSLKQVFAYLRFLSIFEASKWESYEATMSTANQFDYNKDSWMLDPFLLLSTFFRISWFVFDFVSNLLERYQESLEDNSIQVLTKHPIEKNFFYLAILCEAKNTNLQSDFLSFNMLLMHGK